jgi:hypothetical protein
VAANALPRPLDIARNFGNAQPFIGAQLMRRARLAVLAPFGQGNVPVNLISGKLATLINSTTAKHLDAGIGPAVDGNTSAGNTPAYGWSGFDTTITTNLTFGVLFKANHSFHNTVLAATSSTILSTNGGFGIRDQAGAFNTVQHFSAFTPTPSISFTDGAPYFAAVSFELSSGALNFVSRDLSVPASISSGTATNNAVGGITAGDGIYCIGGADASGFGGDYAMAFITHDFFPMQFLTQWALDPPAPFRAMPRTVLAAAGGGAVPWFQMSVCTDEPRKVWDPIPY